jgi:hypothetical protein
MGRLRRARLKDGSIHEFVAKLRIERRDDRVKLFTGKPIWLIGDGHGVESAPLSTKNTTNGERRAESGTSGR